MNTYQSQLKAYVDARFPAGTATPGSLVGKKILPRELQSLLAGTLQNSVVLVGARASSVPSSRQHKFTYRLYASQWDQQEEAPLLSFTEKTSKLAGKRLTLAYVPASQADEDLIDSYLPAPHADGTPIRPSELPTSLPGYLIRVKPKIFLEGVVVAEATASVQMGTDLYSTGGFTQLYDVNQWDLTSEESNVAGSSTAIGISAGGVSGTQFTRHRERLLATKTMLETGNSQDLTREHLSGDLLTAVIWNWFAVGESHSRMTQGSAGIVETPGLSYGLFHAAAEPVMSWGVIRTVRFPGVNMDVSHLRNLAWASDNDSAKWILCGRRCERAEFWPVSKC